MRPTGFKLYAWVFGCNLDELREPDLTKYASLGEFFYRELAEGVRPIANAALVRVTAVSSVSRDCGVLNLN